MILTSNGEISAGSFRRVVPLERLKLQIVESRVEVLDEKLLPLLLFRGGQSIGRIRALWNLIHGMMLTEVETVTAGRKLSQIRDARHLMGLHAETPSGTIVSFMNRLRLRPDVIELSPHLKEYVADLFTTVRWGQFDLTPLSPQARRTKRLWRLAPRQPRRVSAVRRQIRTADPVVPDFWPFITEVPTDEHLLLMKIDQIVPKMLPESIRQDVCQDLIVEVLSGQVTVDNLLDAVPEHVKRVFQMYPIKYGPLSLDMPAPWSRDDDRPLKDLLVSE